MDMHTHFLRDDTPHHAASSRQREAVGKAGWNPALAGKPQTIDDLKFAELLQGDLPRQRHQGRVHQRLVLGRAARSRS